MVNYLGQIKTKKIDWDKKRWLPHVIQTCVWLGTSQTGFKSLKNTFTRTSKKGPKGEGEGEGEGKGKGKGKGVGKDKGKDKGKDREEDKKRIRLVEAKH